MDHSPSSVRFSHSLQQEMEDLQWIYSEHSFFVRTGYKVYYPAVPDQVARAVIDAPGDPVALANLEHHFSKIYVKEIPLYEAAKQACERRWAATEPRFLAQLGALVPELPVKPICYISRYGPGGTYYPPHKIAIRVLSDDKEEVEEAMVTLAHEYVHLAIDPLAIQYELGFENTELLVDLLLTASPLKDALPPSQLQGFGEADLDTFLIDAGFKVEEALQAFRNS